MYLTVVFGGYYDILHLGHKAFILKGIEEAKRRNPLADKVHVGIRLVTDSVGNTKGKTRPFFSYEWRYSDLEIFLRNLRLHGIINSFGIVDNNELGVKY